jgi:hypothetical protein
VKEARGAQPYAQPTPEKGLQGQSLAGGSLGIGLGYFPCRLFQN